MWLLQGWDCRCYQHGLSVPESGYPHAGMRFGMRRSFFGQVCIWAGKLSSGLPSPVFLSACEATQALVSTSWRAYLFQKEEPLSFAGNIPKNGDKVTRI